MNKKAIIIVLDSVGIGELPDAANYGDKGADTLGHIINTCHPNLPHMMELGLANIDGAGFSGAVDAPKGCYGKLREVSAGKDTTTGHWEIAGLLSAEPLPTFPNGFPQELLDEFTAKTGYKVLCNKPYSGTEVIRDYGEEHMKTGALIVYTSADSVFQIAANEALVPIEKLYEICTQARELLTGKYGVGRVIARPFVGDCAANFTRTPRRQCQVQTESGLSDGRAGGNDDQFTPLPACRQAVEVGEPGRDSRYAVPIVCHTSIHLFQGIQHQLIHVAHTVGKGSFSFKVVEEPVQFRQRFVQVHCFVGSSGETTV